MKYFWNFIGVFLLSSFVFITLGLRTDIAYATEDELPSYSYQVPEEEQGKILQRNIETIMLKKVWLEKSLSIPVMIMFQ